MKIILDTHVIIWSLTDDKRLSGQVRDMICSNDNIIFYSVASLWEIALKNQKAQEKCPYNEQEIMKYCNQAGYICLNIQPVHVSGIRDLKIKHDKYLPNQDPFDRLLISQAKTEKSILISHDKAFEYYDEKCVLII